MHPISANCRFSHQCHQNILLKCAVQHLTESAFADRLCFGSLDRLCIRLSKAVCPCSTSLALTKNKITGRTFLDVSPSDRFFRNQIIPMLLHKWPLLEALRNASLDRHTKGSRQHRPRRTHCTTCKIPRKRCEQPWLDTYAGRHLPTSQIVFKSTAKPMLGVQWHTKGEEINWLEPKQPRVTRHTHITLIIVQILNLNHHDVLWVIIRHFGVAPVTSQTSVPRTCNWICFVCQALEPLTPIHNDWTMYRFEAKPDICKEANFTHIGTILTHIGTILTSFGNHFDPIGDQRRHVGNCVEMSISF